MIDETSIAFNLCHHKNSSACYANRWRPIRMLNKSVIEITQSFKTAHDFFVFIAWLKSLIYLNQPFAKAAVSNSMASFTNKIYSIAMGLP